MLGSIYKVTNKQNKKVYIGQTIRSVKDRIKKHIYDSRSEKKLNKKTSHFHKALVKYGITNFIIEVICEVPLYSSLNNKTFILDNLEQKYIDKHNSYKKGYNSTLGGDGMLGYKHTEETKKKMSEIQKRNSRNINSIKALKESKGFEGYKHTEETKKKMSESTKGSRHTEETKKKMSESGKLKTFTNEHKKNLSEAAKQRDYSNKVVSDKTKKKMSESRKKKEYYNIMKENIIIKPNVIWADVIKIHQGLRNTSKEKPLGVTPQSQGLLKKSGKTEMIGYYIIKI